MPVEQAQAITPKHNKVLSVEDFANMSLEETNEQLNNIMTELVVMLCGPKYVRKYDRYA